MFICCFVLQSKWFTDVISGCVPNGSRFDNEQTLIAIMEINLDVFFADHAVLIKVGLSEVLCVCDDQKGIYLSVLEAGPARPGSAGRQGHLSLHPTWVLKVPGVWAGLFWRFVNHWVQSRGSGWFQASRWFYNFWRAITGRHVSVFIFFYQVAHPDNTVWTWQIDWLILSHAGGTIIANTLNISEFIKARSIKLSTLLHLNHCIFEHIWENMVSLVLVWGKKKINIWNYFMLSVTRRVHCTRTLNLLCLQIIKIISHWSSRVSYT